MAARQAIVRDGSSGERRNRRSDRLQRKCDWLRRSSAHSTSGFPGRCSRCTARMDKEESRIKTTRRAASCLPPAPVGFKNGRAKSATIARTARRAANEFGANGILWVGRNAIGRARSQQDRDRPSNNSSQLSHASTVAALAAKLPDAGKTFVKGL